LLGCCRTLSTFLHGIGGLASVAGQSSAALWSLIQHTNANVGTVDKALAVAGWVLYTTAIQAPLVTRTMTAAILGALTAMKAEFHELPVLFYQMGVTVDFIKSHGVFIVGLEPEGSC
jgi:hypothetical protein